MTRITPTAWGYLTSPCREFKIRRRQARLDAACAQRDIDIQRWVHYLQGRISVKGTPWLLHDPKNGSPIKHVRIRHNRDQNLNPIGLIVEYTIGKNPSSIYRTYFDKKRNIEKQFQIVFPEHGDVTKPNLGFSQDEAGAQKIALYRESEQVPLWSALKFANNYYPRIERPVIPPKKPVRRRSALPKH